MRNFCLATVAAVGALAIPLPGSASGAVTIGSNLATTPHVEDGGLIGAHTFSQRRLLTSHQATGGLISPVNGVVVRWRVRAGNTSPPIAFRVIRPGGDAHEAVGAGTSPVGDPLDANTTSFAINPGLPIRVGDGIGFDTSPGVRGYFVFLNPGEDGVLNDWFTPLADGGPPRPPDAASAHVELLLQAVIEPDKDGDLLGDESQDPDGGTPDPAPVGSPAFSASPASVSFANQRVGTTSAARQVTVRNTGTAGLAIGAVALTGANPADFVITANGCGGQTLAPGATCAVSSAFRPTAKGSRTASLQFADNALGSPHGVALSGRGCGVLLGTLCL